MPMQAEAHSIDAASYLF